MIRKLKIKFVSLSMLSLFVLLFAIVSGMNILNYNSIVRESDEILSILSHNKGAFPETPDFVGDRGDRLPPHMSPELPYESRYFSVLFDGAGEVIRAETDRIISVDENTAVEYAESIIEKNSDRGFKDTFRYVKTSEGNGTRITFLDCGRSLDAYKNFLFTSVIMAVGGYIIVFFIISFFSERIIRPIAESYEKQKRFITDAGHEIKTPLTIISANTDILEMDIGKNESLEDIRQQAKRLTTLTNDLVYLARMEESENTLQMIEFPISEVVQETAMPFGVVAKAQNKEFSCNVQPMLSMKGNDKAIKQLVSVLMDNAMKYSPAGGTVALELSKQGRNLILEVFNTTEISVSSENLSRVFDRFYRTDPSRNSETGGHGIGLSVAKAIVTAHGGKISADTRDGKSFQITATLPVS